ncbi:hypothetical protein [Klenkia taihuensis]|uniref:Uncharacterized protein n=1 Tax=Klenkia taihuensis TaxID=1225127 RepID=A0A1I1UZ63_9ACTN|nr:hypothetical protein [Klenkia taihuensis]SFD73320.1 hypothetical protein SAMN05661030_4109 [Klenkia taihuensis]
MLQGVLAGVATGCLVGNALEVYRPFSGALGGALLALLVVSLLVDARRRAPRSAAARQQRVDALRGRLAAAAPTAPAGFLAGRRLGDALAWLATEHAVTVLERVGVTEDSLAVLAPGPQGPRLAQVTEHEGRFLVEFVDLPADPQFVVPGRFTARDVAPDVLPRALDRARREHPATWTEVTDAEAVLLRPDRLRDEVTVQLHNGSLTGLDQTLWASASGDVLFVQESLS